MRIAVIADTHMPKGARQLPERCTAELRTADLIVHAGDFSAWEVYAQLCDYGPPVVAVSGNVDDARLQRRLPETAVFDADGAEVGVIHDAGSAKSRFERMRARFPGASAVIFGHSHLPLLDGHGNFQIFNPGSPTERRRAPTRSMGLATAAAGRIQFRHVRLK